VRAAAALLLLSAASCAMPRTKTISISEPAEAIEPIPDPEAELSLRRHLEGPPWSPGSIIKVEGVIGERIEIIQIGWGSDKSKDSDGPFKKADYGLYANPIP
jgi:hypothetical protein